MLPLPKVERSRKVLLRHRNRFSGVSVGTAKGCQRCADLATAKLPGTDRGLRRISVVSSLVRNSGLSISGSCL